MGEMLLLVLGVALLALVTLDVLATTLTIGTSAGPFTRRVLGLAWRLLLRLHRRDSHARLLSTAGVVLLVSTVLIWVGMVWAGWSLIFLAGGETVVSASDGSPAGVADTIYYVGFTLSTLGVGDFVAAGPTWRMLTVLAGFGGLVLVTLAITYLLAVVSAVVSRRSLAVRIHALGDTAAEIVTGGWSEGRFTAAYVQHLVGLTAAVATAAEQHLAYPILHYFHSPRPESSAPVALVHLDDTLLLLGAAVAERARPEPGAVEPLRRAVDRYLTAAGITSAGMRPPPPPAPDVAPLAAAGIPLVAPALYDERVAEECDRRRRLHEMVAADGWSWPAS
jgi:hypothetical protein